MTIGREVMEEEEEGGDDCVITEPADQNSVRVLQSSGDIVACPQFASFAKDHGGVFVPEQDRPSDRWLKAMLVRQAGDFRPSIDLLHILGDQ